MSKETRNEGVWEDINRNRDFMKCPDFTKFMPNTDQSKELPQPPFHPKAKGEVTLLSADFEKAVTTDSYMKLLDERRSLRTYDPDVPMTKEQLAFLLWSTQGIQDVRGSGYASLRPVPSGGARHPFETYFFARNVEGLEQGVYRYLPDEHIGEKKVAVEFISSLPNHEEQINNMLAGQKWGIYAPVVVFYTCVAYRAEWRYTTMAHRVVLIDLGHVGQNFMLSAEAMGLGSCCLAAYDPELCDKALGVDGYEEYTVYVCTVGKAK